MTILFGSFLAAGTRGAYKQYWLIKDAGKTLARITNEYQHNVVDYEYTVDSKHYQGSSQRNYEDPNYRSVRVRQNAPVYFSISHPWLSSLETPVFPPRDTLFYVPVFGLEVFFIIMTVKFCFKPKAYRTNFWEQ